VLGHQRYKGRNRGGRPFDNGNFDYTVWKIGATYDFGKGFAAGVLQGHGRDSIYFTFKAGTGAGPARRFVTYSF